MSGERVQRDRRPLRVVLLTHTAELSGAELALARLVEALPPDVEATVLLGAEGPLAQRLAAAGVSVHVEEIPTAVRTRSRATAARGWSTLRDAAALVPYLWRLRRRIAGSRADLVCSNSLKSDLLALVVCVSLRMPLVWFVHDRIAPDYLPTSTVRLIRGLAWLVSGGVIANSAATAATLPGVRRTTIAYPGYTAEQVGCRPSERRIPGVPRVGLVGRISPTKGQLEFVRAAAVVHAARPEVEFVIAGAPLFGEEAYADALRSEIADFGLADVVQMVGHVLDPRPLLDSLAIAVHASPVPEPFGQVVVEAMIRGVPMVATRGGGVDEIMHSDAGLPLGWMVPPGDGSAMATAITEVLENPVEATRRAEAAYVSTVERFPLAGTVQACVDAWSWAVERGRNRADTHVTVHPQQAHGGNA